MDAVSMEDYGRPASGIAPTGQLGASKWKARQMGQRFL